METHLETPIRFTFTFGGGVIALPIREWYPYQPLSVRATPRNPYPSVLRLETPSNPYPSIFAATALAMVAFVHLSFPSFPSDSVRVGRLWMPGQPV